MSIVNILEVIVFLAACVGMYFWICAGITAEGKQRAEDKAEWARLNALPYTVVSVNGETALVERHPDFAGKYSNMRLIAVNAFSSLKAGDVVEARWSGYTLVIQEILRSYGDDPCFYCDDTCDDACPDF